MDSAAAVERAAIGAQAIREFRQNARNFNGLIFAKLHEAIIQVDRFERLDENGLARGARSVNHAGNALAGPRRARESRSGRFAA